MINFSESGHPVFRGSSALERADLKSKGKGKMSLHFNGNDETVDVILRTVISVHQLSVHGAVADICRELAWEISKCSKGRGKPGASSRPLRSRDHDQVSIWRWNSLMGEDRERDKQIRNGDFGRDSHRRHWSEYGETRCEVKTKTDTKFDVVFHDDSNAVSSAEMNSR